MMFILDMGIYFLPVILAVTITKTKIGIVR